MVDNCAMSEQQVIEAFITAQPMLSSSIIDLTIQHPSWLADMWDLEEWPRGNGTIMQQLVFRGEMPAIERGLSAWKKLANNTGCTVQGNPDSSYNWTQLGGTSFEKKLTELMRRDFRSPSYGIHEIQTTAHFEEVFVKIVENLHRQIQFFKEINIGQNILTSLAKKFVVDSAGAKANTENPYVYRPLGTAKISALNDGMLEFFYEWMKRIPSAVPYDMQDGRPLFALECSDHLLRRVYKSDPTLKQDIRFSSSADSELNKYNFRNTIGGMFIAAPIQYPRRFETAASGELVEVLPYINGIPADVGTYTGFNPAYEDAPYEEVLIHGKKPFKLFFLPTESSLPGGATFGPEDSFFNQWKWVNPQTTDDPARRVGFFFTSASIGVSAQYSEGVLAVLVQRPSAKLMASYFPEPTCPPTAVECRNSVPAVGCPCPLIAGITAHPVTANRYFVEFYQAIDAAQDDTVQLELDTGGYLSVTVVSVSTDGKALEISVAPGTSSSFVSHVTGVYCGDSLGCQATVQKVLSCSAESLQVILSQNIKATVGKDAIGYCSDGSTVALTTTAADMLGKVWTFTITGSCACGTPMLVCVPTTTDATCKGCGNTPTVTQCAS